MATVYVWGKYNVKTDLEFDLEKVDYDDPGMREVEELEWDDNVMLGTSYELYEDPTDPGTAAVKPSGTVKVMHADETGGYEGWFIGPPPYFDSDFVTRHYSWIGELYDCAIGGNYNRLFFYRRTTIETEVKSKGNYITDVTSTNRSKYPDNGMDNNEEYWYVYKGVQNTAPTTPSSITVPSTLKENVSATISWGSSTDADGNLSGYILEQKLNGGSWTQIYKGSARSKSVTPQASWNKVAYRVKAYDSQNAMSGYKTSATVTVQHNSAPSMPEWCSVPDPVKGGTSIKITWPASTDPDGNLSGYILERKFDSNSWAQIYKGANRSYMDPIPLDKYKTVTYRVKAYDTKNAQSAYATSVTRTIQNSTVLKFRLKSPIESAKRAAYGQEIMTYTIPSGATFKAEACNNGFDENPTWEDITEFVKKQKIFEFANKIKTASKWGYDIRVTIDRNGATGNCYFTRGNGFFEEEGYIPPETDPNTLLLLHCDDLLDSSGQNVPITNSGVTVSTAQSKFGGKSLYFNGSAYLSLKISEIKIDFNSDWTLDWWEYPTNDIGYGTAIFHATNETKGLIVGCPSDNMSRIFGGNSDAADVVPITNIGSYTLNKWTHRAVCRKSNTIYCFENGNLYTTVNVNGSLTLSDILYIGRRYDRSQYYGYIDELRISNIARWTTSFTPPTQPYSK